MISLHFETFKCEEKSWTNNLIEFYVREVINGLRKINEKGKSQ